tara:strand:- start:118 stop:366 length:249 start_codon:yes stop_codon:yes gene_type:complete
MALFAEFDDQPYSDQTWHDGVVVSHTDESDYPYIIFFETDSVWEHMDLPDETVVFRKGCAADVCVVVSEDMLPGSDSALDCE